LEHLLDLGADVPLAHGVAFAVACHLPGGVDEGPALGARHIGMGWNAQGSGLKKDYGYQNISFGRGDRGKYAPKERMSSSGERMRLRPVAAL
jgi:hypothetical protein